MVSCGPGGGGNPFSFHSDLSLFPADVGWLDVGPDLSSLVFFQNGLNALHLAAKEGHVDLVQELLDRGAAVDSSTKVGYLSSLLSEPLFLNRKNRILLVGKLFTQYTVISVYVFCILHMFPQNLHFKDLDFIQSDI